MIDVDIQFPQEQRTEIRQFRGFTDWTCNCPEGFFNIIENIDFLDDGSLCSRFGSELICPDSPLTAQGNIRIERLACFKDKLFIFQEKKISCKDSDGTITTVTGPKGDELTFEADEDTCSDHDTWNEHLIVTDGACSQPVKIYCNEFGQLTAKAMGLPGMNLCPDVVPSTAGTSNYIYAFFYCCEYQTQSGKTFQDVGPVKYVRVENAPNFTTLGETVEITNIPELVCPDGFQYNLPNTKVHIYRTAENGTTFFEVAQIPATQTTYSDGIQDNNLQNNQVIYNQGSSIQWTPAPASEFVEVIDDVAWYAGKTCVDGITFDNRLYQSIPGNVSAVPREFYVEFEGRINGLSQYARFPIVSVVDDCGECKLFRVSGRLDNFGRDQLIPMEIASSTAAINNNSFVRTETGLYFFGFGGSGIYRTDAYKVQKVTQQKCNFDETYCRMIETPEQRKRVYGEYDKKRNKIYWAVTTHPGLSENNKLLVYHEQHNAFTWYSNDDCFQPSALSYDNETSTLIRGDARGYSFEHTETSLTDPAIDVDTDPAAWGTKHIPFCLQTTPFDFGDCVANKQVNKIYFRGKPGTNSTFQIESFDNGCKRPVSLNCVEFKQTEGWCSDDFLWCEDPDGWCVGTECHMYQCRRFPCTRTMTKDKAVKICSKETILECGLEADAFINFNAADMLFTKQSGFKFNRNNIGQTIELLNGEIATITAINSDGAAVVTFEGATPAAGDYAWALRGYPKNERFCLDCMGFFYCIIGTVGGEFTAGESKALSWDTAING